MSGTAEGPLRCPSCGAPFDRPDAQKCAFCGSTLARAARSVASTPPPNSGRPPSRFPPALWSIVFVAVAIGLSSAIRAFHAVAPPRPSTAAAAPHTTTAAAAPEPPSISDFLTTLPAPSGGLDVLVDLSGDEHPLARLDGRAHAVRWRAGSFGDLRVEDVIVDAARAYVVDQSRISALRLTDGHLLWQTSLASEIGTSCDGGCFAVVKDRIVALQRDGSLQAFDAASGQQVWSVKIPGTPSRFSIVGTELAVNRASGRSGIDRVLDLLDAADGRVVRTLEPSCIDKVFHRPQRPDVRVRELFSADRQVAYFFFGDFSRCAQAMSLTTGQKLWNSYIAGMDSSSHFVLGARQIVFEIGRGVVISVETANGKVGKLVDDEENRSIPMYVMGDTVILHSSPSWSSDKVSLVGVDAQTGARRWQFPLSAKNLSLSLGLSDDGRFFSGVGTRPTSDGLVVAQVLPKGQLSVDVLNPKTGVSAGRKLLAGDEPDHMILQDERLWLRLGNKLEAFALPGMTLAYQVP